MQELDLTVERIDASSNALIVNLFEYYLHDMAEWFLFDVGDDGRFSYDMSKHWERGDEIYIARYAGKLAGFAIVGSAKPFLPDGDGHDVEEFFVIRRYRHTGAGEVLARRIWEMHPGQWLVRVYEGNLPAIPFWRKIISRHTHDRQIEERRIVNGKAWSYFHFKNSVDAA
jgi:predicted acetyltransferase